MRVSVVCPVFNTRPDELRAGVASVLAQEGGSVDQLLLVDDRSTAPDTLAVLDELGPADPRITTLRAPRNGGPAAARNLGLAAATGEWIGFLDADDLWPAEKLGRAAAALAMRPRSQWLVGDISNFTARGCEPVRLGAPCFQDGDDPGAAVCSPVLTRAIILEGLHLGACLIRRELIADRRFDPVVTYGEDLLFLAKLSVVACADRAPGLSYLCRRGGRSMMYSPGRLSSRYAGGARAGMRDRELRAFRREYRWALYDIYKELGANNLLNGQAMRAARFALRALLLDPRELTDFVHFVRLLLLRDKAEQARQVRRYSRREQFILDPVL